MSGGPLDPDKSLLPPERETPADDVTRVTPVKRRRLLNLVDLRVPGGMTSPGVEFGGASPCLPSLSQPVGGLNATSSLGHGRRSRTPLTDLDSKFVTKSGLCGSLDIGEGVGSIRGSAGIKITHLTASTGMPVVGMGGSTATGSRDDTLPRFPRLDQCAHFHYEYVELPPIQVALVSEELKPLSQGGCTGEDSENRSLLVQVASLGRSWVVRRTYDNFRFLDKQLHRCCYDRKFSQLKELPPEENFPGDEKEAAIESTLRNYLRRFSEVAGSLITCGPVLGWFELDNRGHRLIVTDDSDINTPAVAAAYVTKRYTAQASDEISFEVGDMISVIDMPPPEESIWWRGKRGFQVGFFPCECVQVIGEKGPQAIHPQALTLPPTRSSSTPPLGPTHHSPLQASSSVGSSQEPIKPVLRKHGKLIAFFRPDLVEDGFRSFILSRPSRRRLKQSGILRERVFGCDLGEHLLNSGHEIPMVLKCCAEFIESHGTVDGIYRLSGITSNIQKLRNAFDEERVPELYGDESILQDIHCVSSVLKMYFRELPNPLLTYQLYDKFVTAVMESEDIRLLHVRDVVQQLPPPHYRTLEYLIQHLARIASHSSNTGMTPRNIAIVWAPNLLRSKDLEKGGVAALQDVGTQAVVTEYLVHYVDLIFNDKIPVFSPSTNGLEGTPKKSRPKSLAISTPAKLLSIDEARNKALAAIKSDQKYIEVGGGPKSLPKTYHTVIDLPSRKGGSLKQKKSPLGWKTLFSKNKHQRKASTPNDISLNISDPVVTDSDIGNHASKRLRPVKSVESLVSTPVSLQSNRNSQVSGKPAMKQEGSPVIPRERKGSISSECSSIPSPRTHNRSVSHDSYFNLLERSGSNASPSGAVKEERETDMEMSPENSSKIFLDISELNLEFNTSEAEMKIFSEDETLKSTSVEDTLSRSTVDIEENVSICSDITKSKESVSSREKKSLKDKLRKRFTSPSSQRKETAMSDSSEDSRSNSLKRASSVIKDKLVQALSPETSRKKAEAISLHLQHISSPMNTPKQHPKVAPTEKQEKEPQKATNSPNNELSNSPLSNVEMIDEKPTEVDLKERTSIESALIDPELLEKITRMRVSPSVSASEVSSVSLAEATVSDNESFTLESSPNTGSNGVEIKGAILSDSGSTLLQSFRTTPSTLPVTIVPDPHFQQIYKRDRSRCSREEEEKEQQKRPPKSKTARDRPNSLMGIPISTDSCGLGSALTSPETPQGDSTFIEIQYHPLSDTTEPSTPSESHFMGNLEENCSLSMPSRPNDRPPRPSSPLSPDLSSSSADDPIENGPLYENIEVTSLSGSKFANLDDSSSKVSLEVDTPTAEESEMEYENIQYNTREQSFYDEDNSRLGGSSSVTPSYENLSKEFPLRESRQDTSTEDIITAYENVMTPSIRIESESLSKIDVEGEYEYYSFKNEPSYENVDFSLEKEEPPSQKTEAEIQGEVVYQQVKYLRKSIQEVNEILNEEINMSVQSPSLLESINLSHCQSEVVEQEEVKREERGVTPDIHASEGSECLDSPVTPSSSSLVTEVLVLPSFSSPTESTTEDATSPDASESQNSPKQPPNCSISRCTESLTTVTSSLNSVTSFIPTLSPPSPDLTGVVPLAVTLTSTRTLSTTLTPSPWPRSGHKLGQVWPPIPKPRNLPSLSTGSSPSTQNSLSDSPLTSAYCAEDPSTTEEMKAFENPSSQRRDVVHIVEVPLDNCRHLSLEKGDRMEDGSNVEELAYSSGKFPEEDNAQKRERIEKYKEERRSFLREKYKSESFKGEKDDMLLRLKQKATSPNRQDDMNESLEFSGPDPDDSYPFNPTVNVLDNSEWEIVEAVAERSSAPSMTTHLRFQSSDNSSCMKANPDSVVSRSVSGIVVKTEPLNRSNSQECNVFSEGHVQKAKEVCLLSSTTNANVRIPTRTLSDSSSENRDEDINVKERVAIWNRHEVTSLTPGQKGDCRSTPPPKLRKVQDSTSTITDSNLQSKSTKNSPAKSVTMPPKHGEDGKINASASSSSVGQCQPHPRKVGQINGAMVGELPPQAQIHKGDKNIVVSPKTTPGIPPPLTNKTTPQAIAKRPILVTQKSESDLREPIMLKARSYSIGSGLGTSGSSPRGITAHQKSIKDMKALFEARDSTTQEVNRRVVIRPTSRDWIGK